MAIADSDPRMSQIVVHGGIVYLSGQVDQEATDAEGQTKGKQSRHCMKMRGGAMLRNQKSTRNRTPALGGCGLSTTRNPLNSLSFRQSYLLIPGILTKIDTLAAAGIDKSKLISAQIWVKDISQHFKPMNKVWCAWLDPKAKSARATDEANLVLPSLLVDIQVTCAV